MAQHRCQVERLASAPTVASRWHAHGETPPSRSGTVDRSDWSGREESNRANRPECPIGALVRAHRRRPLDSCDCRMRPHARTAPMGMTLDRVPGSPSVRRAESVRSSCLSTTSACSPPAAMPFCVSARSRSSSTPLTSRSRSWSPVRLRCSRRSAQRTSDAVGADRETLCATERTGCLGQVVKARGVAGSTAEHDPQVLDQAEIRPEHLEEPLGPARGNRLILGSEGQTNRAGTCAERREGCTVEQHPLVGHRRGLRRVGHDRGHRDDQVARRCRR